MDDTPQKPIDKAYLRRATLAYLQRYASSAENLRKVLHRKVRRRLGVQGEAPDDLDRLIDDVIAEATKIELVDDRRFAEGRIATLLRRGTSRRMLQHKLSAKGIEREVAQAAIEASEVDDLASCRRLAQRRKLGPWRTPPDPDRRDRDLAILLRAGYSHSLARSVIDGTAEED